MSIVILALSRLLDVISTLIFIRAICSWFPKIRETKFFDVLVQITEPILMPVRKLLFKMKIGNGIADFSIIATYLLIILIQYLLRLL
ncbi:MAG: YggT family protein [Clostridia bacterium]|nr:YggT family protein [Clostridia bacterium]